MMVPKNPNRDPNWDTRRNRLDVSLGLTFGLLFFAISKDAATATAIALPAFGFLMVILPAYFGVVEWGRVNKKDAPP